jgi:hypothetical protein
MHDREAFWLLYYLLRRRGHRHSPAPPTQSRVGGAAVGPHHRPLGRLRIAAALLPFLLWPVAFGVLVWGVHACRVAGTIIR